MTPRVILFSLRWQVYAGLNGGYVDPPASSIECIRCQDAAACSAGFHVVAGLWLLHDPHTTL